MVIMVASIVGLALWGALMAIAVRHRRWRQALGGAIGLVLFIMLAPTTCVVLQSYGGITECSNLLGFTTVASGTTAASTILGSEVRAASPLLATATVAAIVPTLAGRRRTHG